MIESTTNENFIKVKRYDGREILTNRNFNSAVRVKVTLDVITWLVETLEGEKILIDVQRGNSGPVSNPDHQYTTHHGSDVEKFAKQLADSQSNAHHLLLQLV